MPVIGWSELIGMAPAPAPDTMLAPDPPVGPSMLLVPPVATGVVQQQADNRRSRESVATILMTGI
jgi:hypothetical protein